MKRRSNYRNYSHHVGGSYYEDVIKTEVPPENLATRFTTSFYKLSSYYPVVINPTKKAVYYHPYNKTKGGQVYTETFLKLFDKEIHNTFDNGYEYLLLIDGKSVGNDKFVYGEYWCGQPISMISKASSFMYLTLGIPIKEGIEYYVYPLKAPLGGKFLELYHGRYFCGEKAFTPLGVNILANMVRLMYSCNHVGALSLREAFVSNPSEDMKTYNIAKFMLKGDKKV